MRKFLSDRTIVILLFVSTLFVFVLAEQYTRQNGMKSGQEPVSRILPEKAANPIVERTTPATIIVR